MEFLKFAGRNTNYTDAIRILEALSASPTPTPASLTPPAGDNQSADAGVEDDGNDLALLKVRITALNQDYEQLNALLSKVLDESTRQNAEGLKDSISAAATSYRTAYDMTTFYSKEWFSRLFFTVDGKQDLALHLLSVVKPFNVLNTGTFEAIINEDPDMLEYISTPHKDY
jgi:hypothetical protein